MAFGSTITLTVNSVAKVLNRINQDNYGSTYLLVDTLDEYRLNIRHTSSQPANVSGRVDRHYVEVIHTTYATPTTPEIVRRASSTFVNAYNDDKTSAGYLDKAVLAYLASGTVVADLLTWQS